MLDRWHSHSSGKLSLRNSLGMLLISYSPGMIKSSPSPGKAALTPEMFSRLLVTTPLLAITCCPEMDNKLLLFDTLVDANAPHGCELGRLSARPEQEANEWADSRRAGDKALAAMEPQD